MVRRHNDYKPSYRPGNSPVAVNAYVTAKISKATLEDIGKEALPLIITVFIVLCILILFPQIVLWLPNLMRRTP